MNVLYARMLLALQEKLKPNMDALGTKYYALDTGAVRFLRRRAATLRT